MPTEYDVEIYDDSNFVTGFNGANALCSAIQYTKVNTPVVEFVTWDRATDVHWVGPRPGRP